MARKKAARGNEKSSSPAIDAAKKAELLAENARQIAEFAQAVRTAARELGVQKKRLESFSLSAAQREVLLQVPGLTKSLRAKLSKEAASFTFAEAAALMTALARGLPEGDPPQQITVLTVAHHLTEQLQAGMTELAHEKPRKASKRKLPVTSDTLFQFKVTLIDSKPPIWRRIQAEDCTLDKLHEHIQMAMGWTNSHLHQFEIAGERYGDPEMLGDEFEPFEGVDSTRTMLSMVVPESGERFRFRYEYDFGDGWLHEVLFEGCPKKEPGQAYPLCVEGARACPPEDVGGIGSYYRLLRVLANPKHEQHADMTEWIGGPFDPDNFDAKAATREMRKGLPNWRE